MKRTLKIVLISLVFLVLAPKLVDANIPDAPYTVVEKVDVGGKKYLELIIDGVIGATSFNKAITKLESMRGAGLPIVIQIDTPGGDAGALFKLFNSIRNWDGPLITINNGSAFSCGALIYMLGDVRIARIGSQTMWHGVQFVYPERLNMSELVKLTQQIQEFNQELYKIAEEETDQSESQMRNSWFDDMNENNFLSPEQLDRYGLLDLMFNDYFQILQTEGLDGVLDHRNSDQQDFENRGVSGEFKIVLESILRTIQRGLDNLMGILSHFTLDLTHRLK